MSAPIAVSQRPRAVSYQVSAATTVPPYLKVSQIIQGVSIDETKQVMQTPMQQLELVSEAKIFDILPGPLDPRLEASGVLAKDGMFYVIFDNLPDIACISPELSRAAGGNRTIVAERGLPSGFEDIAHDPQADRFYVLIESLPRVPGGGRVQAFRRGQDQWDRVAQIPLPETVLFQDYSGIAVDPHLPHPRFGTMRLGGLDARGEALR